MNRDEQILLNHYEANITQRKLSKLTGFSLGKVNNIINKLLKDRIIVDGIVDETSINRFKVNSAIILAAGYGLRLLPINKSQPKALLEINGEILIERIIKQLADRNINNIYVVVGYQKEKFEYLIEKYNIELIVNPDYGIDHNLLSLLKAKDYINHSYIIPGDLYLTNNVFNIYENNSWYLLSSRGSMSGYYYINRDKKVIKGKNRFYDAVGISFISSKDKDLLKNNLLELAKDNTPSYWEDAFFLDNHELSLDAMFIDPDSYCEINTVEDLRKLDAESDSLNNENLDVIKKVFNVELENIKNIHVSKKGMTNNSFLFEVNNKKYIMRIPGEGTDKLINRNNEYNVYQVISPLGISDNAIYMDPGSGIKITEFIEGIHNADPFNFDEVKRCMDKLREFHNKKLKVDFEFKIFDEINYYEKLRGDESLYSDYDTIKNRVFSLKKFVDENKSEFILCHIDSVPDNFLLSENEVRLIDWEYSANQDPHLDIAMFAIYSGYKRNEIDKLIDLYFDNNPTETIRMKIYAYISIAGLLWSNWCEYKHTLGIEFGEYSLNQYRYAKQYSKIVLDYLGEEYE